MQWKQLLAVSSLTCLLGSAAAQAQGPDPELTMTLVPRGATELPDAVTREIELPGTAAEEGETNSAEGLETANESRARAAANREDALARAQENAQTGLDIAAEARERGTELGAEIADTARAGREDLARGGTDVGFVLPDGPPGPDNAPDAPRGPDVPEAPAAP